MPGNGNVQWSGADDSDDTEEDVPLSLRPEWAGESALEAEPTLPVVCIQYEPPHREALAYLARVVQLGERSERALALTQRAISFNHADYTAWEWRWQCLRALEVDLTSEYELTDSIMQDNTKNYQLWNHRRKCAMALGPGAAQRELEVTEEALAADDKNYHAWAHRQAIVQAFGGALWEHELVFSELLVTRDLRNNSAWNQRMFCVRHELQAGSGASAPAGSPQAGLIALQRLMNRELQYLAVKIARAPRNESTWNYLKGLFSLPGHPPHAMGAYAEVAVICREALLDVPSCPPAIDALAEHYLHLAYSSRAHLAAVEARLQEAAAKEWHSSTLHPHDQATGMADGFVVDAAVGMGGMDPLTTLQQQLVAQLVAQGQALLAGNLANLAAQDQMGADNFAAGQGAPAAPVPAPPAESILQHPAYQASQASLQAAATCAIFLWMQLRVADPIRNMYWRHRQQEAHALLLAAGLSAVLPIGNPVGGEPPNFDDIDINDNIDINDLMAIVD